jgi:hypothetical protein
MGTGTTLLTLLTLCAIGQATPGDVTYMNDREFKIPIAMPASPAERAKIAQLHLYVSKDQGRTWQKEADATPRDKDFGFVAPMDGTYWFNVSITDTQKRTEPADISSVPPALKVVIDTRKPLVKFLSADRQGDQVSVAWDIREDNPDLGTLKLEYRTAESREWRAVPVSVPSQNGNAKFAVGTGGPVSVRLGLTDLAGNMGSSQNELAADASGAFSANATASAASAPPAASGPMLTGRPGDLPPAAPSVTENPSWAKQPAAGPKPATEAARPTERAPGTFGAIDERAQRVPIATSNQPPPRPMPLPTVPSNTVAVAPTSPTPPPAPKKLIQYTNTPQVDLDYEVSKVGPSGVGQVTLYVTTDEGNTWKEFGDDSDLLPPFNLELPSEGQYGFMLVVRSKAGLGRAAPQPGQAPDIRVELDTTQPEAVLYKVEADPRRKDMLFLTWDAMDKNLAEKPINLYWSKKPDGDWQPIALELANSGRHAWQMPSDLPFKVYLRLEVHDLAGNVARADTPEPVLVDLTEPEGKITGLVTGAKKR